METCDQKSATNQQLSLGTRLILLPVKGYRYALSPMMANHCRFYPSCSTYAEEALHEHGALKGAWLAAKRICRCHPFHPGGYDPVPEKKTFNI